MRPALFPALLFLLVTTFLPCPLPAAGWEVRFDDQPGLPPAFVAVDKAQQRLLLLEHKSPLQVIGTYSCTTGQVTGDKQNEGDLRTPEGVYFVNRNIRTGLDFDLYGGIAYTLDYPNPMDVLRNKSGHGIWVHGRGHTIVPQETQGCVAMNNPDIIAIGEKLAPGTPVILAQSVVSPAPQTTEEKKIAAAILDMTREWAAAWGNRDAAMFEYYDTAAYSRSGSGSYDNLLDTKTRLFDTLPWIINWIDDVHVLQGPGYWVSWFKQYYRAPNLTVQGIRRLYWHKNDAGDLLIAGMEWQRKELELEQAFINARKDDVLQFVEGWRSAWESANFEKYAAAYTASAQQGTRSGIDSIMEHKHALWVAAKPEQVRLSDFSFSVDGTGLIVEMKQHYRSADAYEDVGRKTLVLYPEGASWRIASEDWRSL